MPELSLPDYLTILHLNSQETEFPLIPACLITYFYFRGGSISVSDGLTWGKRWVKDNCTTAAVMGRFKRLVIKYSEWLQLATGTTTSLMLKGTIPISQLDSPAHNVNMTIAMLCFERLEKCLPAECAIARCTYLKGDCVSESDRDRSRLYRLKQAEHQRLLSVTEDLLHKQYIARRSALTRELEHLDDTWMTPLTQLKSELDLELRNWIHDNRSSAVPQVTESVPLIKTKPKRESLSETQRNRIRAIWKDGTQGAKERVIANQLTLEHVSWSVACVWRVCLHYTFSSHHNVL